MVVSSYRVNAVDPAQGLVSVLVLVRVRDQSLPIATNSSPHFLKIIFILAYFVPVSFLTLITLFF